MKLNWAELPQTKQRQVNDGKGSIMANWQGYGVMLKLVIVNSVILVLYLTVQQPNTGFVHKQAQGHATVRSSSICFLCLVPHLCTFLSSEHYHSRWYQGTGAIRNGEATSVMSAIAVWFLWEVWHNYVGMIICMQCECRHGCQVQAGMGLL